MAGRILQGDRVSMLRRPREALPGTAEEDGLLAVAREARLHEELHVAAAIGAGDVEPGAPPPRAVAQEVLDETEADVAGIAMVDGIELDDGPLVAVGVALHAGQAGQPAVLLVDVELVVRLEGAERHAEQAEDRDVAGGHGQSQRASRRFARLARDIAAIVVAPGAACRLGRVGQSARARRERPGP